MAGAQEPDAPAERCVMNWTATAAWSFNFPVGDLADDRYDADDYAAPSEEGGLIGGGLRFSWPRGWWVETGLNVGYSSARVIPADVDLPLYGLYRWSVSLPVTGGWYYKSLIGEFGIGPKAGLELIRDISTRSKSFQNHYNISSSRLWRQWNVAALVGLEWGFSFIRVDMALHIDLLPVIHRSYRNLLAGNGSVNGQFTVGAKFLF